MDQQQLKKKLLNFREIFCFSSQLYSSSQQLIGNQIVLPSSYCQAYEFLDAKDGLFAEISNIEESKENTRKVLCTIECSATENACFVSDLVLEQMRIKSGSKVRLRLLENYLIGTQITIQGSHPEENVKDLLMQEIQNYRCLQINDLLKLQNQQKFIVVDIRPDSLGFVVLVNTDLEVIIEYKEQQSETEWQVKQENPEQIQTGKVKATIVGTGEIVEVEPMQSQVDFKKLRIKYSR